MATGAGDCAARRRPRAPALPCRVVAIAGCRSRIAGRRSHFEVFANRLLTALCGVSYIGFIDGGAACERVAGIDASEFVFGVCLAGFAGCVVVFPVWLYAGLGRFGVVLDRLCCLTIASEERETWAAGSLRPGASRARCSDALRENCTDGHVSRFIASALLGWTDVFGTRRDDWAWV